jgi:hypothetical protein
MQFCKDSKRQRSRLSKAWLSFLKLPLPLDIYKKVSSLQFLCICFVLTMPGFKLQLISGLRSCLRHLPGTILGIGTWKRIHPDALDAIALLCTENLVDCKPKHLWTQISFSYLLLYRFWRSYTSVSFPFSATQFYLGIHQTLLQVKLPSLDCLMCYVPFESYF